MEGRTVFTYEICVEGELDRSWSDWFHGLSIEASEAGATRLTGAVADQSALHGILDRLHNLGLALVSVQRLPASQAAAKAAREG